MSDALQLLGDAAERARRAKAVRDAPAFREAVGRLEAGYIAAWRATDPGTDDGAMTRETLYFRLRALDELVADLDASIQGGEVAAANLAPILRRQGRT